MAKEKSEETQTAAQLAKTLVGSTIRDRIVDFRRVKASELRRNEKNWRMHPDQQNGALRGVLEQVGFVGALIARETPDGLELIDGHLRADMALDAEVPVLITDLSEGEADFVLATFDPVGDLAVTNDEVLSKLLDMLDFDDNADIARMFSKIEAEFATPEAQADEDAKREIPGMALLPHEHYDFLVVLATTAQEWNVLCTKLGLVPEARRTKSMGTARAIRAGKLLTILNKVRDEQA